MELIDTDYLCVGEVAKHCDKEKLCIAEQQAYEYDLKEKLCDVWDRIEELPEQKLKKIWALFSYARYVENSIFRDTASGFVRKDHSNSFPVTLDEIKDISKQYRNMAYTEVDRLYYSLCTEGQFYSDDRCHCKGNKCGKKIKNRLFSKGGQNIDRKGWNAID